MSKVKTIGASPLTGKIYHGTLDTEKGCWVGQKKDVTEVACSAVAEHLMVAKRMKAYELHGGKFLVMRADVVDALPAEFDKVGGAS
ncbi:TPA: hypothetical protein RUY06_002231 [Aeromonas veronii]|nr:hypothetical protein [Aeromonas veronii]